MRRRFRCLAALAIALVGWSSAVASQDCSATLPQPPLGWSELPLHPAGKSLLKVALSLNCRDCAPELWVEVGSGMATASMIRSFPRGAAWAQHVATDPRARAEALAGLLSSARAGRPECSVQGEIEGVITTHAGSFVAMRTQQKCSPAQDETSVLSFAGFDGRCLNDVAVSWKGGASLTPQTLGRVHDLLANLKFGP